jgi:amino acid transporter
MAAVGQVSESQEMQPAGSVGAGLHRHVLGEIQVLAQAVSNIGPSLGAAALIPLVFASAGGASWLTVVIATVGMLAIAAIISELSRRHVSTGALYTLIPKGLGPTGGLLAAGGFLLIALAGQMVAILGFGPAFAQFLTSAFSIGHSSRAELVAFDLGALLLASGIALREIRLSTTMLFAIEAVSMTAITVLLIVVLAKHGHIFDSSQLKLTGASAHGVLLSITILVLAFGGFESAATLGVESRNPRRSIPLALLGSVAVVGVFFIVNAYVQILGFEGTGLKIASETVPLGTLAGHYDVKWLGDIVLLGVSLSWFGCICAWLNYAPRTVLAMSDDRVIPDWLSRTSKTTGAPRGGLLFWAASWLVLTLYLVVSGANLTQAFGNIGYLAGYGYTLLYLFVALAAIGYALRHRSVRSWFIPAALIGGAVMVIEYWYSFKPFPVHPVDIYAYAFLIFVAVLLLACVAAWIFAPDWLRRMGRTEEPEPADATASG